MYSHKTEKNHITVSGVIIDSYYSHTFNGIDYYTLYLSVSRGEDQDIFKIIISEDNFEYNLNSLSIGDVLKVCGYIRSRSIRIVNSFNSSLEIFIYGLSVERLTDEDYYSIGENNLVCIEGTVCRKSYCHNINRSRISSGMIACNRNDSQRADYIPIYASNNFSRLIDSKSVGDAIKIFGRLQARKTVQYNKERIVYEVVVSSIKDSNRDTRIVGE